MAIETSCDETSAAVTEGGRRVLSNVIASQIDIHKVFGGVVPEIASREHLVAINDIIDEALKEADVTFNDIDLIGVTAGPGLIGAVLIGLSTAKGLAFASGKPFVGVHHIKGHINAAFLNNEELKPPFLSLIVSGGHTDLIDVEDYNTYKVLGSTRDDAVGEAFDKVARVIGLGYPGGPAIDELAKKGDPGAIEFKRTMLEPGSLDFSFSGIKTGVMNYVNTERQAGREIKTADIAAAFEASVFDVIELKTAEALRRTGYTKLTLGGGVASNSLLRKRLTTMCERRGLGIFIPDPVFCTDNAAMIACAAYYEYKSGRRGALDMDADAHPDL